MDLEQALTTNYVFQDVPAERIRELALLAKTKEFAGGDVIVRQFDKNNDLIVILEGQAISKTFSGEITSRFGPGSVIGEIALIDGEPRSATVTSVGASTCAILPATVLRALMQNDTLVGYTMLRNIALVLCRRLRNMNEQADSPHSLRS